MHVRKQPQGIFVFRMIATRRSIPNAFRIDIMQGNNEAEQNGTFDILSLLFEIAGRTYF